MSAELTQRFAVDDVDLAWDRWGEGTGTPLVFCHGFSGSAHDFALHVEALAVDRPVLALDHRGHGRSTKLGDEAGYRIARLADDLVAFLEAQAGGPVDLLGHSMGGSIALLVALGRPDLVRSLILMDTSAWSFRTQDAAVAAALDRFFTRYDPARGLPDPAALVGPEDAVIEAATPAWWRARKAELSAAFDPYALGALGRELWVEGAPDHRPRLAELTVPVTVIVGSEDHPFVDQAPELAAAVPGAELVVVDGAFHSPQLTHQARWTEAVTHHLERAAEG